MDAFQRKTARAAVMIYEQALRADRPTPRLRLPHYAWSTIPTFQRQIELAIQRGWNHAAKAATQSLIEALEECRRDLGDVIRTVQPKQPRLPASPGDIYRDLVALADEFEDVEIDLQEETISVTTDRIAFDGIELGDFTIRLHWQDLDSSTPYKVEAQNPNPAAKSDEITHPHVRDEQLCEGEGRAAIRASLQEYRLYDFFLFVSQVLHTYGEGSAYVEMADWSGIPCDDCGEIIRDEDRYFCARCGISICGSCAIPCTECGEQYCANCIRHCAACRQDHCSSCLTTCSVCDREICDNCREDDLCLSCQESEEDQEDESSDETESSVDGTVTDGTVNSSVAIEPESMGQTAVPAGRG